MIDKLMCYKGPIVDTQLNLHLDFYNFLYFNLFLKNPPPPPPSGLILHELHGNSDTKFNVLTENSSMR